MANIFFKALSLCVHYKKYVYSAKMCRENVDFLRTCMFFWINQWKHHLRKKMFGLTLVTHHKVLFIFVILVNVTEIALEGKVYTYLFVFSEIIYSCTTKGGYYFFSCQRTTLWSCVYTISSIQINNFKPDLIDFT